MKALFGDTIIAQSDNTIVIENNHYFPPDSVVMEYLQKTDHHTTCPWKGEASYYSVVADGKTDENAAWYYPEPSEKASEIKNYVAFWKDVEIVE